MHVYVRKNGAKQKSAAKIRARSPKKKDLSPSRRPWIPAPGRSTLTDLKAELARGRPSNREICIQEKKPKRGNMIGRPSREALEKSISGMDF